MKKTRIGMKIETITPAKAEKWLKTNLRNRPLSKTRVKYYADAMRDGKWVLNAESVKFSSNGEVIDGQHRLHAVVESGVTIRSYVARGLEYTTFDTIDDVRPRQNSDRLSQQGEKNTTCLSSAITLLWWYKQTGVFRRVAPRPDQMKNLLEDNPGLRDAVDEAVVIRCRFMPTSLAAVLLYLGRTTWGKKRADDFWFSVLLTENLKRGTPGYTLFRRLDDAKLSRTTLPLPIMSAYCIKAFNAAMQLKPCKILRWGEGESFPEIANPSRKAVKA